MNRAKTNIDDMEETAKNEANGSCCKRIHGVWLEVICIGNLAPGFKYKWGKNWVTRQVAINVLESA